MTFARTIYRWSALRLFLLVTLTTLAALYGWWIVTNVRYADLAANTVTAEVEQRAADSLSAQSNKFSDWALLILGGVIAISVTTKVHAVKGVHEVFILLGPAGAFLLMSLRAGWTLQRRLTNIIALDNWSDLASLASLLISQTRLFLFGLTCATLFGLWHLVNVVAGTVSPHD